VLLRSSLPAAAALFASLSAFVLGAPLRAAPSLQALQGALNSDSSSALQAVLQSGAGLDPAVVLQRRDWLRAQFPDASWQVSPGSTLKDGRATTEVNVRGSRQQGAYKFFFEASQTLVLGSSGDHFNSQEVIQESSTLRSGDPNLKVSLLIPDAVLTGQRYDLDVVFDDPLNGAVVAGAIKPVSVSELLRMQAPDLQLEALGGGGLFKSVQAPFQPGSQTWAVLLVHPKGIVAASKQVRVVASKTELKL
jgi:hypothetical protein